MEIFAILGLVLLGVVVIGGIWLWATYNKLVALKVRVEAAWSDITVQLKRRADLIPNLIETVKSYTAHEKGIFEAVIEARASMLSAQTPGEAGKAEGMLEGALKNLFAVAEAYPDLKASENFLQLQKELVDTEDKVMAARRFYNAGVRDINTSIRVFPTNMIAKRLSFTPQEFFDVEDPESIANPPKVEF